jgi:hypothetical protein
MELVEEVLEHMALLMVLMDLLEDLVAVVLVLAQIELLALELLGKEIRVGMDTLVILILVVAVALVDLVVLEQIT